MPHQSWQLIWLFHDRAENRNPVWDPVGAQTQKRCGRQVSVSRIDDDPTGREWQTVSGRNAGRQMRFHIDHKGACVHEQRAFGERIADGGIDARNRRVERARQGVQEPFGPGPIHLVAPAL